MQQFAHAKKLIAQAVAAIDEAQAKHADNSEAGHFIGDLVIAEHLLEHAAGHLQIARLAGLDKVAGKIPQAGE